MTEQLEFIGPCNGRIAFLVGGEIKAPTGSSSRNTDHWITFRYIDQLTLAGGGSFDGQGASAWPYNNCNVTSSCISLPVVSFLQISTELLLLFLLVYYY